MDTAPSTLLARAAALHRAREGTGDVAIACGGATSRAHSQILAMGSDYFLRALAEEWVVEEQGLRKLVVTDFSLAVLAAAIGWMYGVCIPEEFGELKDLLRIADMFLMEELKEEVGRRLGLLVSTDNYREMCEHAETCHAQALAAACAKVVVLEVADADWAVIDKAPIVTAAMARLAVKLMKMTMYKKREDFDSRDEYREYVRSVVKAGMKVRRREQSSSLNMVKVGDEGIVKSVDGECLVADWVNFAGAASVAVWTVDVLPCRAEHLAMTD